MARERGPETTPNLACVLPQEGAPSKRTGLWGPSAGQSCDVFICHRGPTVKGDLVGHIKERLQRANLAVFADYGMRKGVESWPHVLATLRGARGVLILLTSDFEESPWCLEEVRAVAERLDEARAGGIRQVAVLPIFIDRETSWDQGKLLVAFSELTADRDFEQLRAEEPVLAADMVERWRRALDSVARITYLTHSFKSRRCESQHHLRLRWRNEQAREGKRGMLAALMWRLWTSSNTIFWRSFIRCHAHQSSTRWRCRALWIA